MLAAASIGVGAIVLRPDPSFAVTQEANGDIVVTLTRLDDAAGLVRALAEHGVEAEVGSDPGRSSLEIRAEDAAPGQKDTVTPGEPAASAPLTCDLIGVETPPSGGVSFRLPAAAVDADVPLLIQGDAGDDYSSITVAWEDSVC
ncbi:hypothetical protein G5V59_13880 [Nocardioides sp. W3-2-3]|nr:hypothetical protein [Nocardioides convexus]